jgi:glycerophosphoryl diester phosphodiesterase
LLLLGAAIVLRWSPVTSHSWFAQFDAYPLVIAHADDTGQGMWPGNTMVFLENTAEIGVDVLEMDAHMTRDGHIVLMHDARVDRTTDGQGAVSELTLQEIETLEVGGNWSPDGGTSHPYRGQGLRVPTLDAAFRRFPDFPMVVEIKQESPSMAIPLCNLIREHNMEERVLVPSFSDIAIKEFRSACPEVATAASSDETRAFVIASFLVATGLLSPAYQAFQVPEESGGIPVVIPHFVNSAHARGLQVHVWTINKAEDMARLLDMGVDGVMTDRPDLLLALLGR